MNNSGPSRQASLAAVTAVGSMMTLSVGVVAYWYHKQCFDKISKLRQSERTGRIRAEVKLRTAMKELALHRAATNGNGGGEEGNDNSKHNLTMRRIGYVVSPFTKRMGTPRQGALAPSARGYVQLVDTHEETIDGMDAYSHCWIIFSFHANTNILLDGKKKTSKTKIRPPRGNGIKVGQLATRSPHRVNNIGLSLVKVNRVDKKQRRLYISALDLVNGTPVYDIKPYVPWDIAFFTGNYHDGLGIKVPDWVRPEGSTEWNKVCWNAEEQLANCIKDGKLNPLYSDVVCDLEPAKMAISEVLAQDPRGAKRRGSVTVNDDQSYYLIFASVEIEFRVLSSFVEVVAVIPADFDTHTYVDGVPIMMDLRD